MWYVPTVYGAARRLAGSLVGLALFVAALVVLHRELAAHPWHTMRASLLGIPAGRIALAVLATAGSYLFLTVADVLALRHLGRPMPYRRVATASFVACSIAHNVGLAGLGGVPVRVRLYGSWGLGATEVAALVAFGQLTVWIGFLALAGTALVIRPPQAALASGAWFRAAGIAMLLCVAGYLALALLRRRVLRVGRYDIRVPSPRTAVTQVLASSADWVLAGTALWILAGGASASGWVGFLARYLTAQMIGVASQVPGGLGVFEGAFVVLLPEGAATPGMIGALVAFRVVYYLLPLAVGASLLAANEALQHRTTLVRWAGAASPWVGAIAPTVAALVVFVAGVVLLISGAIPGIPARIAALANRLPLGVIETSHVVASAAGAALLVLARGLQRRLDGAFQVAVAVLGVGIVASLLKGLDWEEATVLTFALGVLVAGRTQFYRRASLLHEAFTLRWATAVAAVFTGATWIGLLAHRHVTYDSALWWKFGLASEAPRALRASVAAGVVLIVFGVFRLLRAAAPRPAAPRPDELERAARVVAGAPGTLAPLALLGDKSLLFGEDGEAFVMYGVEGRAWVALGDPVGPPAAQRELAWAFHNEVDRHDGWTVFYLVPPASLPLYIDIGLQLVPLGEEALVPLASFSLEGHGRKMLRHALRRAESEGLSFEIVPPGAVGAWLPELRRISNAWLAGKNTREKRFSLGYFDERYLARGPVALVRSGDRAVAFANVLCAGDGAEASIDLMRLEEGTPPILMDFLLTRMMLWAREAGFETFNLGMAPLSGIEARPHAPAWNRLAGLVYRHGEQFYNFQGLRKFKDKFEPIWQPRYLASPGGLALAPVLVSLAALIAGGVSGIVRK